MKIFDNILDKFIRPKCRMMTEKYKTIKNTFFVFRIKYILKSFYTQY